MEETDRPKEEARTQPPASGAKPDLADQFAASSVCGPIRARAVRMLPFETRAIYARR